MRDKVLLNVPVARAKVMRMMPQAGKADHVEVVQNPDGETATVIISNLFDPFGSQSGLRRNKPRPSGVKPSVKTSVVPDDDRPVAEPEMNQAVD